MAYLGNLCASQLTHYECLGQLTDLGDSISNLEKGAHLTEDENPLNLSLLSMLARSQQSCYFNLFELTDVENSILNLKQSI
jgi:hypothetical protein